MISVLKPLRELTDILAAEKRVSVSAVKPLVQRICNKMLESNNEDTDLAKDMKARIKCDLLRRYDDPEVDQLLSLIYINIYCVLLWILVSKKDCRKKIGLPQ